MWTAVVNKKEVPEVTSQGTPAAPQCVARSPRKTSMDYTTHVHPRGHLVTYVDNHRFGNDANKHQMAFSCSNDPPIRQRRRSNTLPNLPALVGLVMLRNLYNDENDENVPFPEQHEPMEITTLSEEPESAAVPDAGRFASALSRQAQCAILKGYDDMLMDNLSRLKPGCKRYLPKTDTPNLQMFCSPEMEQTRKQTAPVLPKIQRAMEILDGLKKAQGQPITSTTSKGLHNPVRQYRSWRSSWTAWMASWQDLTHWGRDKMDAISQTILSDAFSWMKMLEFRLTFHWSLLLRVWLTKSQHWFR